MSDRRFPLQGGPSIPWDVIAPFEAQAVENHDQSLQRLAERGGLSPGEFWCVMNSLKLPHSNWKASGVEEKGLALANEICEKHSASQERIADLEQQLAAAIKVILRLQDNALEREAVADAAGIEIEKLKEQLREPPATGQGGGEGKWRHGH